MALVRNTFEVQNVGDLLREKRKQLDIDIKQVSEDTKIRTEYLLALESGNFDVFPASVYAKGFLKKYAKYLGINAERITAMYRRETKNKDKAAGVRNTDFLRRRLPGANFNLTTNRIITVAIGILLLGFAVYLVVQATSVLQKPELSINTPVEATQAETTNFTTTDEQITITGDVEIGSTLKLNGSDVNVNNLQQFEVKDLPLTVGENEFNLVARSQFGRESEITLIVVRQETEVEEPSTNEPSTPVIQDTLNTQITIQNQDAYVQVSSDGNPALAQVLPIGETREFQSEQTISISSPRPSAVLININEQQFTLQSSREHVFTINTEGLVEVSVN